MENQALTKIEPMPQDMALESRHAGPLDMEPAAFRAGLDRRKENRNALMEWIRSALVENVDYGRIPTKRGPSKPSLFKPGAEKICGMLGIITTFPTLTEYEQAAFKGVEVKSVVLRCALLDSRGVIVAEGVGARSLAQDYGDLNKALKMAEKSAHIDATLRMAGLSEVFTQDIEDMPPRANIEPERKAKTANVPRTVSQTKPAQPEPSAKEPPQATEKTRSWFLAEMRKRFNDETLLRWGKGRSDPATIADFDDGIDDWPLHQVPTTREDLNAMILECADFTGVQPAPQRPAEPPQKPAAPAKTEPAHHSEDWYQWKLAFGKDKGRMLGELDKKTLFGWWCNYEVETEYNGRPKKPETIAADTRFREMLDEAGKFYKFEQPD